MLLRRTNTHELPERLRLSLQLQELPTQGWSTQRATASSGQRDRYTGIWPWSCGKAMDNPQGCTVTGTASPAPRNASMTPAWPALSSHWEARLAVLSVHIYMHTHIHISIIYIYEIRKADEQDSGLKLCKQQQHLPTPTTTKGRRSPEVRWVPGD